MSQSNAATVSFPEPESTSPQTEPAVKKQPKPTQALPTNRISTSKQWDILRAFGAIGGPDGKSATNIEVSKVVGLHAATVGLITPFFVDIGLLKKADDGLAPVAEVGDFARSYEWAPEKAFQRVAPILKKTWFFKTLQPKLSFSPLNRDAALEELAIAANAAPAFRGQLDSLLDYLREANVITVEGDQIRLQRVSAVESHDVAKSAAVPAAEREPQEQKGARVDTSFSSSTAGCIQFDISVKVNTDEFATWQPSRISAFFAGIAQVLAAKGAVEGCSTKV